MKTEKKKKPHQLFHHYTNKIINLIIDYSAHSQVLELSCTENGTKSVKKKILVLENTDKLSDMHHG